MDQWNILTSTCVCLKRDYLDNNDIIPSFFAQKATHQNAGRYVFNNQRYLPGLPKRDDPRFPLNQKQNQKAKILLPGLHFAETQAFESAVWGLKALGFRAILSNKFGSAFLFNAYRNGLLPITLHTSIIRELEQLEPLTLLTIDLVSQNIITPYTNYSFEISECWREQFLNGSDNINKTMQYLDRLEAYETKWNPIWCVD